MGLLTKNSMILADFSKVVYSTWFNAPQASFDAATAQFDALDPGEDGLDDANLPGIIPLWSFGPAESYTTMAGTLQMSRSCIGISCGSIDADVTTPGRTPKLYCRLQYSTGDRAEPSLSFNDFFEVGAWTAPKPGGADFTPVTVTGDVWNHLLVSFDMSGGCSAHVDGSDLIFDSACKFYWALNDVNYNGASIGPYSAVAYGNSGDNDIISGWCSFTPGSSFAAGNLPVNGQPFGIPVTSGDATRGYKVHRADTQIFTGVTLDTSVLENRRLFITSTGGPASPALAAAHFGKTPEFHFQTASDWISGNNRGTADSLTPTGTITAFSPGPI